MKTKRSTGPKYFRIVVALIILFASLYWFLNLPIFNMGKLVIEGNEEISAQDIVDYSGITQDQSIIFVNKEGIKENISRIPRVADVKVKRRPLKTLKLEITERTPSSYISQGSLYLIIDKTGTIYEQRETVSPGLMAIKGLKIPTDIKVGSSLYTDDDKSKLLQAINDGDYYSAITDLELREEGAHMTLDGNVEVAFGSYKNIEYKLSAMEEIYSQILKSDQLDRAVMILMEEGPDPILFYE